MAVRNEPAARERARECMAAAARAMNETRGPLSDAVHQQLAAGIPELRGDPALLELLRASTESNIETFLHFAQHAIPVEEIAPPTAALAYARRLAQRGTSSNALLRAYRLGQRGIVELGFAEVDRQAGDAEVAYLAAQMLHEEAFRYVDRVAQQVVTEYEAERERWLANRNSVRSAMLARVLDGEDVGVTVAETALRYRLRRRHLGLVLWNAAGAETAGALRDLESLAGAVARVARSGEPPLFIPHDGSLAWAWIAVPGEAGEPAVDDIRGVVTGAGPDLRVAIGTSASGPEGFRTTHRQALRAREVAVIADERAHPVTAYGAEGVRAAALVAADVEVGRELVAAALGALAVDDENAARLRETLLVFLGEGGSYLSTGRRLRIHKNTVKYRVDRAAEARGRPIDADRFELELALHACCWLGSAVLR
ncbi:PucR family transcriptional regulator [Tsukamurella pulmonis]|uniref:PucR family transcriptional regulator n=1 Tax=Tsukamurella pulmonis TaxID=47312 RepID=UPI0020C74F85|nr:helix-turn-helix domain-containing protein [Tsukamurella pulmonis]